jgi:hypothetical protein
MQSPHEGFAPDGLRPRSVYEIWLRDIALYTLHLNTPISTLYQYIFLNSSGETKLATGSKISCNSFFDLHNTSLFPVSVFFVDVHGRSRWTDTLASHSKAALHARTWVTRPSFLPGRSPRSLSVLDPSSLGGLSPFCGAAVLSFTLKNRLEWLSTLSKRCTYSWISSFLTTSMVNLVLAFSKYL